MRTINGFHELDHTKGTHENEAVRLVFEHRAWGEDVPSTHQKFVRWDVVTTSDGRKVGCWV